MNVKWSRKGPNNSFEKAVWSAKFSCEINKAFSLKLKSDIYGNASFSVKIFVCVCKQTKLDLNCMEQISCNMFKRSGCFYVTKVGVPHSFICWMLPMENP